MSKYTKDMPEELKGLVENMSGFQRKYCENRSKGMKQADAAIKAGSEAKTREIAGRTGYNTEQVPGVRDYINFLIHKRATYAMVESTELIDKLREVYNEAMEAKQYGHANKAIEHLGNLIGAFDKDKTSTPQKQQEEGILKNNVEAFKDEDETTEEKFKKLRVLLNTD